jgi:mRNA-degrading endonuclease RelE of RelBE toxin-antitoxin system
MVVFVETQLFTRLVDEYLSDDEYLVLQGALAENPTAGPVIRGSGGIRKLRWRSQGRGKRGGLRVIYYLRSEDGEIWDAQSKERCVRPVAGDATENPQGD